MCLCLFLCLCRSVFCVSLVLGFLYSDDYAPILSIHFRSALGIVVASVTVAFCPTTHIIPDRTVFNALHHSLVTARQTSQLVHA